MYKFIILECVLKIILTDILYFICICCNILFTCLIKDLDHLLFSVNLMKALALCLIFSKNQFFISFVYCIFLFRILLFPTIYFVISFLHRFWIGLFCIYETWCASLSYLFKLSLSFAMSEPNNYKLISHINIWSFLIFPYA